MAGGGKSARGRGHGKDLTTPREMRKRKDGANAHMEDHKEGTPDPQGPGPSQEGKKKRKTKPTEPLSSVTSLTSQIWTGKVHPNGNITYPNRLRPPTL